MHKPRKKILIVGCGGGATKFAAVFFSKLLNADIKHQRIGKDGASGWFYAADSDFEGRGCRLDYDWDIVLHQFRQPLKTISSFPLLSKNKRKKFVCSRVGYNYKSTKELYFNYYIKWHKLCDAIADYSYCVEDLYGKQTSSDIKTIFKLPGNLQLPRIPDDINHHTRRRCKKKEYFRWEDFLGLRILQLKEMKNYLKTKNIYKNDIKILTNMIERSKNEKS